MAGQVWARGAVAIAASAAMVGSLGVAPASAAPSISFKPKRGPVGTVVKVTSGCTETGLGKPRLAVVGLHYDDAFSTISGASTFHEVQIEGARRAKSFTAKIKVKQAHKYTPGTGANPLPEVKRKPKPGDKVYVQVQCYYKLSAYPDYASAGRPFKVTRG